MTSISFSSGPSTSTFTVDRFSDDLEIQPIVTRALSFHPHIGTRIRQIKVEFDGGLKREAGNFSTHNGIRLHPGLMAPGKSNRDLIAIFLHELAHAMQWLAYGKIDHQATWHEMMYQLGQAPSRFHSIAECMGKIQPATLGLNPEDLGL